MTTARYIIGDTRDVIASLPDQSVDLVLTSPPFLALRSYLPADHPDKHLEIGSEATPADFLDVLLDLTEEWARVLAPHGSICVELGDTYAGSGGGGGDYSDGGWREGQNTFDGSARRGKARESRWSYADAQWLAALIDAEGSIAVQVDRRDANPRYAPVLTVSMNSPAMIKRADEIAGVGNVHQKASGVWTWSVHSQQARYVLLNVWPYLMVKQEQAKAAIELARHVEERRRGRGKPVTRGDLAYRESIRLFIMNLNDKGGNRGRYPNDWQPPTPPHPSHNVYGTGNGWPMDKGLCGIPTLYAWSLAYGRNLLRPERETDPWRIRNVVAWCLDIDTPVYVRTPTGDRPMRLLHLHQQFAPGKFQLWDGTRWTPVLGTSSSVADDALEIEFRNGERISCTREHEWPVDRLPGVVRADELRVGDIVPTVQLPEPDQVRRPAALPDDDIGWFVGMYLAEGSFDTKGRIQFAGHVDETLRADRLHRIAAAYDGTASTYNHDGNTQNVVVRCDALAAVVRRYIGGTSARNKHLAPHVWGRSNGFLAALLDGYLEGDGHYDAKNDRWRLGFTDNPWLARDLRVLCARLGYRCRIKRAPKPVDLRGGTWTGTASHYYRGEIRMSMVRDLAPSGQIVAIRASKRRSFIDVGVEGEPHLFALASGLLTHNCRPNPPVGALGDKFRPATSYMTIATKSRTRWFDLDAVRSDPSEVKDQRVRTTNGPKSHADPSEVLTANYRQRVPSNPAGTPPLDWWNIPTEPYKGSHYATWPRRLLERPILSMCPLKVCRVCGEPQRRITEADAETRHANRAKTGFASRDGRETGRYNGGFASPRVETVGWTDCGHNAWRNGVVLDPFAGTGTTLAVATGHGRDAIGIDIDERNADLALERIGPLLLTVERHRREGAA